MDVTPTAPVETGAVHRLAREVWRIVAPNPSPLTGAGTNTYVIGRDEPLVIDPGPDDPDHLAQILDVAGSRVRHILCTHSHPDHSPGAAELARRTGADVRGRTAPEDGHQDPSYRPDVLLEDGVTMQAGVSRLRVLHTPGHASNHVCFLLESEGLLFTGDHLMSGSTVVILPPDGSMRDYLGSLHRLRDEPVRSLAPGHGALMPEAIEEIERVLRHRLAREAKLVRAIGARGSATLDEVLAEVYDDVPKFLHGWARHSLLAHALKLLEEARVELDGERYRWRGD